MPPEREVEFYIDLIPGTTPITKRPESCLEGGVNRQVETFSTKTRNELVKTSSTGVKTGSTGLHELN
jgi:hypothetical protein